MGILLITLAGCILILAIIVFIVWRKTDWGKMSEASKNMYDSDGTHIYQNHKFVNRNKGQNNESR